MRLYLTLPCLVAAAGGFLFGFDTSVISGVIEYIAAPRVYNLDEISKGWTVSCIIVGCMMGCAVAGPLSSRCGRKAALILTALVFLLSSLGCAMAGSYGAFIGYRIVAGVAVGAASMLAKRVKPASRIVLACFQIPRELWRRSGAARAPEAASRHPSSAAATGVVSQKQLNNYKNTRR